MTDSVSGAQSKSNTALTSALTGNNTLGKDAFLKLLITQLQNQDPLNPMDDREFISQMATFSQLEQMTNMNTTLETYLNFQASHSLVQYSGLIGKEVEYNIASVDEEGNTQIEKGTGVVKSVQFKNFQVLFELEDGKLVDSTGVSQIKNPESSK